MILWVRYEIADNSNEKNEQCFFKVNTLKFDKISKKFSRNIFYIYWKHFWSCVKRCPKTIYVI